MESEIQPETRRTYCRLCVAMCGVDIDVHGDQVLSVHGQLDHPLSHGYTCAKGRALPRIHHDPLRLDGPSVRRGNQLMAATWDDCLDDLGDRLRRIIEESGPESIGVFIGGGCYLDAAGYFVGRRVPAIMGSPALYTDTTIDVISKPLVSEMMSGVVGKYSRPDYGHAPLIVFCGINPVVSHGHTSMLGNPVVALREMTETGEIWTIDPRRTETARLSTRHLAPRPGTDYAIFAFLVRELLRSGADQQYVRDHTVGVESLAASVEPFTAIRAAEITELSVEELEGLLAAIRRAGTVAIETGTGVSMAPDANVTQWLSWAVMILTRSLDHPGGAWFNPGYLLQMDRLPMPVAPPDGFRPPGPRSRPELLTVAGQYPCAAMADEIDAGNLRALLNFGGNLVAALPGAARTRESLRRIEVLASFEVVATETTELSTHVLANKGSLERSDLTLGIDPSYSVIAAQYTERVIDPVADRRSMWWTIAQVGKRIGYDFLPGLDPDSATDDDVLAQIAANSRGTFDDLRRGELVVDTDRHFGWIERQALAMGGWRLAPQPLVEQLARMEQPAPLVLIPRRQRRHANARFRELGDQPDILMSASDAHAAGVENGQIVVVSSAHGNIRGVVTIDSDLRPGAVSIPHGYREPNVNDLTSTHDVDQVTGMPRYSGLAVTVRPAQAL
ncbi:MAG: molybdopterin-dependent oxidoreductase [Acidimicrobiales bacterium]